MKPQLRTRHRRIWMVWALILPALFAWAYLSIPKQQIQEGPFPESKDYPSTYYESK